MPILKLICSQSVPCAHAECRAGRMLIHVSEDVRSVLSVRTGADASRLDLRDLPRVEGLCHRERDAELRYVARAIREHGSVEVAFL